MHNTIDLKNKSGPQTKRNSWQSKLGLFPACLYQETARRWSALILFVFGSFFPLTSWGFNFFSTGYSVDFEESYGKSHSPMPVSVISTADGGYAFAGSWGGTEAAWLVKTDSKGHQQWEQAFQTNRTTSWQRASVALPTTDGGYLMGGDTNALDLVGSQWDDKARPWEMKGRPKTALVSKIDKAGQVIWKKIFGVLGKYYSNAIYRGIAVEDGFIFLGINHVVVAGQSPPSGTLTIRSLWLFKINEAGEMLWEKTFQQDDGEYLMPSPSIAHYSKLVVDKDGNIAFATAIEVMLSEERDGKRVLVMRGIAPGPRKKVLLIKLDRLGNEVTRTRLAFGVDPTLMVQSNGYQLLNNEPLEKRSGIRSLHLDAGLQVLSERVIPAENFWIQDAVPGPDGGLHISGYHRTPPNERGEAAVAYLSKDGELRNEKLFGSNSWPADLVGGSSAAEAVFLWWGGRQQAAWLTKLRLAN